jgi:polyisoprenoid-binding protein YceI
MKTRRFGLVFFCLLFSCFFAQFVHAAPIKLTLDLKKSGVKWSGKFMGAPVTATMKFKSGEFLMNHGMQKGKLVADMTSLHSDSGMDEQFKSPMLLNVDHYPTAELVITQYQEIKSFAPGGPNARVNGTVTFRGKSHPVQQDFVFNSDQKGFHVVGTFKTAYSNMVEGLVTYEVWAKR